MNKKNNYKETYDLKMENSRTKTSYKKLIWTSIILVVFMISILLIAFGIEIAKNGVI